MAGGQDTEEAMGRRGKGRALKTRGGASSSGPEGSGWNTSSPQRIMLGAAVGSSR